MSTMHRKIKWTKEGFDGFSEILVERWDFSKGAEGFVGCRFNSIVEGGIRFSIDQLFQGHFEGFTIEAPEEEGTGLGRMINGGTIQMSKEFARFLIQGLCENECVTYSTHPQYGQTIQLFSDDSIEYDTYNVVRVRCMVTMDVYGDELDLSDVPGVIERALEKDGYALRDVHVVEEENMIIMG